MTTLGEARAASEKAHAEFTALVASRFPGADKYHWYRALSHINGTIGRWNDDTSRDEAMAADVDIRAVYDDYIKKLHAFYRLRDGDKGVLGGRGL